MRIVYGKSELAPAEIEWLRGLTYVRTAFCKNLHAKCYLSEEACIVTSMNLYEFSMVNNNEMGVFIVRDQDVDLYREAYDEAQRIIRISEEVRISMERVERSDESLGTARAPLPSHGSAGVASTKSTDGYEKLTSAKLAGKLGMQTRDLTDRLCAAGLLELREGRTYLTSKGKELGGEWRPGAGGGYMLWPADFVLPKG